MLWNARSICNKTYKLIQALDGVDIAFLTETWLHDNSGLTTNIIKESGFSLHRTDRGSRGGGIAILYKNNIECKSLVFPEYVRASFTSFEHHTVRLITPLLTYCIICIYRKQEEHVNDFLDEIDTLLDHATNKLTDTIIVLGDFNIHFDVPGIVTSDAICAMGNYQLRPAVTEPTHKLGHTLDQIFYDIDSVNHQIEPSVCSDLEDSDHYPIYFTLPNSNENNIGSKGSTEWISYRRLKQIDTPIFRQSLIKNLEPWYTSGPDSDNFSELCANFKNILQSEMDHHAPLQSMRLKQKPTMNPHWFDWEYLQERRKRRSLERKYKKYKTAELKRLLSEQKG